MPRTPQTLPRYLAITLWLLICARALAADTRLEVFDLKHRPADQLVATVQPLLAEDEVVQGHGFQLILRARPQTIDQVRTLLQRLDRAPQRLRISVRHTADVSNVRRGVAAGGRVKPGEGEVRVRVYGTDDRQDSSASQQIQVLEGNPAFIAFGQSVPVGERTLIIDHGGGTVHDSVRYRDVTSGFYVLPHVVDQRVHLRISPRRETLSPSGAGVVDVQRASTVIEGPLREWIELGGTLDRSAEEGRGIVYSTTGRSLWRSRIAVKVDVLP